MRSKRGCLCKVKSHDTLCVSWDFFVRRVEGDVASGGIIRTGGMIVPGVAAAARKGTSWGFDRVKNLCYNQFNTVKFRLLREPKESNGGGNVCWEECIT